MFEKIIEEAKLIKSLTAVLYGLGCVFANFQEKCWVKGILYKDNVWVAFGLRRELELYDCADFKMHVCPC